MNPIEILAPRDSESVYTIDGILDSQNIAVVLAPRLGDSLLTMVLAQNLQKAGKNVVIFGDYIKGLSKWFPDFVVKSSLSDETAAAALKDFDFIVQMHKSWPFDTHKYHDHVIEFDALVRVTGRDFQKLSQLVQFSASYLGVKNPSPDNGLRSLDITQWRSHKNRIVIHPTSTGIQRCWDKKHFKILGLKLQQQGWEPNFIVAPHEKPDWLWVQEHGFGLPSMPSLSDVALFIHQSAWFIGNESGIGHLSSNLGVPTLSLTGRPTRTKCWLPAWTAGDFVYPWWIPGGRLRDKYWRTALSPRAVISKFNKFQANIEPDLQPPGFI